MNWHDTYTFNQNPDNVASLLTDKTCSDFSLTLSLDNCDTGANFWKNSTTTAMDVCTGCAVTGSLDITNADVTGNADAPVTITTEWANALSWECQEFELFSVLTNDDYTAPNDLTWDTTESYDTTPTPYTDFIWDNFPVTLNSTITVTGRWNGTQDDPTEIAVFNDNEDIWPDCSYAVDSAPTLSATIEEGADINSHNLTISSTGTGWYGQYCP